MDQKKISSMRTAGQILANTFEHISEHIVEGISAGQVDDMIRKFIESNNAYPGFLGYQGFKYSSCISKNEEI